MGWSFRKRVRIAPGITVNLSKSGVSTTFGGKGAHVTIGGKRGTRTTVGLPGTGLSYSTTHKASKPAAQKPPGASSGRLWPLLIALGATLLLSFYFAHAGR